MAHSLQDRLPVSMGWHMNLILVAQAVLAPCTDLSNSLQVLSDTMSYLIHDSLETKSLHGRQLQIHLVCSHGRKPILFLHGNNVSLLRTWPNCPRVRSHNDRLTEGAVSCPC